MVLVPGGAGAGSEGVGADKGPGCIPRSCLSLSPSRSRSPSRLFSFLLLCTPPMRILLTKLTNTHHALEIVRTDGSRERAELVTREFLFHDLLHYAVESSMGTQGGVWGALASGKTFADLNDRTGAAMRDSSAGLAGVEVVVGMMTGAVKRMETPGGEMAALREYHAALGKELPPWCTEDLVAAVRERMRRLQGHWKATPYGKTMEIAWAEPIERRSPPGR
jgi:hypothetical protein